MSLFSPLLSAVSGTFTASGASDILKGSTAQKKLGSGTNAVANIQTTLDQAKYAANKQSIMAAVQLRIQGISEGTIEPQDVWEKVAGYLTITGQPFTYNVDEAGQVEVTAQSLDDLSFANPAQQGSMRRALERLDEVRLAVDTVNTKGTLRNKLLDAVERITDLELHAPANEQWEKDFNLYKGIGRPVMLGLDAEGNVTAVDQLESGFDYVEDASKRAILQQAGRDLENILNGTKSATETWHYAALGNRTDGDDFFLDVDENNEVVVRRNQSRVGFTGARPAYQQTDATENYYVIPDFLKPSEEDDNIFRDRWEEEAATFILSKKPFHIELVGDRIVVRETSYVTMHRMNLLDLTESQKAIGQARVNILS